MEHIVAVPALEVLKPGHLIPFFIMLRISCGGQHHAYGGIVLELQLYLVQGSVHAGFKHIHNVILHPWQNYLSLRISEPGIVLQHLGAVFRQHQAKEDNSFELPALCLHGVHGWLVHILSAECIHLVRIEWAG